MPSSRALQENAAVSVAAAAAAMPAVAADADAVASVDSKQIELLAPGETESLPLV